MLWANKIVEWSDINFRTKYINSVRILLLQKLRKDGISLSARIYWSYWSKFSQSSAWTSKKGIWTAAGSRGNSKTEAWTILVLDWGKWHEDDDGWRKQEFSIHHHW